MADHATDAGQRRQYSLNGADYRYGFNGKEGDDEVKGDDNQQDYGMRIYDPRVARFLSVDPITREYPELTPYQFASNTPIQAVDLDGLEAGVLQQHQMSSEEAWANLNVFGDFLLGVAEAIMAPFNAVRACLKISYS